MVTKRSLSKFAVAVLVAGAGAIACTPAKAPGSNPEDMTPEEHRAAAQEESEKAAEHRQDKENVPPSKPMTEDTQKAQHEQQAEKHENYSEQHEKAAEAAEGTGGAGQKPKK